MQMRAKFLLGWTPSISNDIVEQRVNIVTDGASQTVSYGRDVEEHTIDVAANSSVLFTVDSIDAEGNVATSVSHSFSVGDLVDPQPATLHAFALASSFKKHLVIKRGLLARPGKVTSSPPRSHYSVRQKNTITTTTNRSSPEQYHR